MTIYQLQYAIPAFVDELNTIEKQAGVGLLGRLALAGGLAAGAPAVAKNIANHGTHAVASQMPKMIGGATSSAKALSQYVRG